MLIPLPGSRIDSALKESKRKLDTKHRYKLVNLAKNGRGLYPYQFLVLHSLCTQNEKTMLYRFCAKYGSSRTVISITY